MMKPYFKNSKGIDLSMVSILPKLLKDLFSLEDVYICLLLKMLNILMNHVSKCNLSSGNTVEVTQLDSDPIYSG